MTSETNNSPAIQTPIQTVVSGSSPTDTRTERREIFRLRKQQLSHSEFLSNLARENKCKITNNEQRIDLEEYALLAISKKELLGNASAKATERLELTKDIDAYIQHSMPSLNLKNIMSEFPLDRTWKISITLQAAEDITKPEECVIAEVNTVEGLMSVVNVLPKPSALVNGQQWIWRYQKRWYLVSSIKVHTEPRFGVSHQILHSIFVFKNTLMSSNINIYWERILLGICGGSAKASPLVHSFEIILLQETNVSSFWSLKIAYSRNISSATNSVIFEDINEGSLGLFMTSSSTGSVFSEPIRSI